MFTTLNTNATLDALHHRGVALLKGFVQHEAMKQIQADVVLGAARVAGNEGLTNLLRFPQVHADYVHADSFWVNLARSLTGIFRGYLGGKSFLFPQFNCSYRRFGAGNTNERLAFHQDEYVGVIGEKMLTLWVLVTPDSTKHAAGIEFLPSQNNLVALQGEAKSGTSSLELSRAATDRLPVFSPQIALGDVLIFTGRTPHRTAIPTRIAETRISADMRIFSDNEWVRPRMVTDGLVRIS